MFALLRSAAALSATAQSVGVVGGGMAGVTAARRLAAAGVSVTLYEREEELGGRLGAVPVSLPGSGRTIVAGAGCSYIKADDDAFQHQLDEWVAAGCLAPWDGAPHTIEAGTSKFVPLPMKDGERWYCGAPHMGSPLELTGSERALIRVRHTSVTRAAWSAEERAWTLDTDDEGAAEQHPELVLAVPVSDAELLLRDAPGQAILERALPAAERAADFLKTRWAAALAFEGSLELPFRFGFVPSGSFLTVLIDDSSRRAAAAAAPSDDEAGEEVWVLQTETAWAQEQLIMVQRDEASLQDVLSAMHDELARALGRDELPPLAGAAIVPWVYGDKGFEGVMDGGCAWLSDERLALAGDYAFNGRVQGAWRSGRAAADRVLRA